MRVTGERCERNQAATSDHRGRKQTTEAKPRAHQEPAEWRKAESQGTGSTT